MWPYFADLSLGATGLLLGCYAVRSLIWLAALMISLRGTRPKDRAQILRALGPAPILVRPSAAKPEAGGRGALPSGFESGK